MTSNLKYNPLLKLNLQEENEAEEITVDDTLNPDSSNPIANSAVANEFNTIIQRIDNYQDVDVTDIAGFESAVGLGATGSVRIHLRSDITLTSDVSYNLDNVQVYGHDNNINLQNHTFTVQGNTCYFYQVRFNANSNVTANSASNYSNACINLFGASSSTRFFFEYVIFRNFLCKASDVSTNIFNVKNVSGAYPSLHLYLMFCEVMTNYVNDNINNCTAVIYHSGSLNALTCHNVDFWGNKSEANSCPNWCYAGNNVVGAAKLGWITDGSSVYNKITGALTPNMVNQYNPSFAEFQELANTVAQLYVIHNLSQLVTDATNQNFNPKLCVYLCDNSTILITNNITVNYEVKINITDEFFELYLESNWYNNTNCYSLTFNKKTAIRADIAGEYYLIFNDFVDISNIYFDFSYHYSENRAGQKIEFNSKGYINKCAFYKSNGRFTNVPITISAQAFLQITNINDLSDINVINANADATVIADSTVIINNARGLYFDNALDENSDNILPNSIISNNINSINSKINDINSDINDINSDINDINSDINDINNIVKNTDTTTPQDWIFYIEIYKILNSNIIYLDISLGTSNLSTTDLPANTDLYTFDINIKDCNFYGISHNNNIIHFKIVNKHLYNIEALVLGDYVDAACTTIVYNS